MGLWPYVFVAAAGGFLGLGCSPPPPANPPALQEVSAQALGQHVQEPFEQNAVYAVGPWPDLPIELEAGAGQQEAAAQCTSCHSARYIVAQPPLDANGWHKEIDKMVQAYGANIAAADQSRILDYLVAHYGPQRKAPTTEAASPGADIYKQRCAPCHGVEGKGAPHVFPPLAKNLARLLRMPGGNAYVASVVVWGVTGSLAAEGVTYMNAMPPLGGALSDKDIATVVTWVSHQWPEEGTAGPRLDASEVAEVRRNSIAPTVTLSRRPPN